MLTVDCGFDGQLLLIALDETLSERFEVCHCWKRKRAVILSLYDSRRCVRQRGRDQDSGRWVGRQGGKTATCGTRSIGKPQEEQMSLLVEVNGVCRQGGSR